jgi:hypothetical protein
MDKNDLLTNFINRARTLDSDFDEKLRWRTEIKGDLIDNNWLFYELVRVLGKDEMKAFLENVKKLENSSNNSQNKGKNPYEL